MKFIDLVKTRQSVRRYSSMPVGKEKIGLCIEAARMAPSASNSQPWRFIVVAEPELKEKVAAETYGALVSFNKFVHQAPVIVAIVIERPKIITQIGAALKDREFSLIDIGIAAEHFCLQAAELGLGTCMLGWFNEKPIKKLLNIPMEKRIGLLIAVGYPEDEEIRNKNRKKTEEMCSYNAY
ncbi:MAG: nitroreductase family protein [Bacteroidia bacterium]|nr:nitroreductase family protein [Bacteroidia bacterium]